MERLLRFLIGLALGGLAFVTVFLSLGWVGSRVFPTVWLPAGLGVSFVLLWSMVYGERRAGRFALAGYLGGLLLLWLASEPGPPIAARPHTLGLAAVAGLMAAGGLLGLLASALGEDRGRAGWAAATIVLAWLIVYFSSPSGGSGGMTAWAMRVLGLGAAEADFAVRALRKAIHFAFYGLLGWAAFRAARAGGARLRRSVGFALGLVLAHAVFDEARQTYFAERTGSAWDVALDVAGAGVFVGLALRRAQRPEGTSTVPTPGR